MRYEATTGVIIYCNTDQAFDIHRAHHVWFDEYNFRLSVEYKHTPCSLIFQQDPECLIHNPYLINLIPCELGLTSTPFYDTIIFPV